MKSTASLLVLVMLACSGCMTSKRIELLNTNTFETVSCKGNGPYGDELVPAPAASPYVYHMSRVESGLKLIRRDIRCAVQETSDIPWFAPWYGVTPSALRADGNRLVYWQDKGKGLYLYNLETGKESLLLPTIASNKFHMKGLSWMDDRYLVAVLDEEFEMVQSSFGKSSIRRTVPGKVIKIDTYQRSIVGKMEIANPMSIALSPSGRLLAVAQMFRGAGIKIIDLPSMTVISEVSGTNPSTWLNNPAWSPDETNLAYIDDNDWLSVFSLSDGLNKRVLKLQDDHICYFVGFPRNDLVVYRSGDINRVFPATTMHFVHLPEGKLVKTVKRDFSGSSHVVAGGGAIASEVGF